MPTFLTIASLLCGVFYFEFWQKEVDFPALFWMGWLAILVAAADISRSESRFVRFLKDDEWQLGLSFWENLARTRTSFATFLFLLCAYPVSFALFKQHDELGIDLPAVAVIPVGYGLPAAFLFWFWWKWRGLKRRELRIRRRAQKLREGDTDHSA